MNTNSTANQAQHETSTADQQAAIDAHLGQQSTVVKNPDTGRYPCSNIRLSAALCSLGFVLRDDAEPVTRVAELYFKPRKDCAQCRTNAKHDHVDVTFYHAPAPIPESPLASLKNAEGKPLVFGAVDIDAWWRYPGKFTVAGFDDALSAMRRVGEMREWLLSIVHGSRRIENARFTKNSVVTSSIRFASVIKACGFDLIAFEKLPGRGNDRFVFPAAAVRVVELITKCHDSAEHRTDDSSLVTRHSSPEIYPDRRDDGRDLCVDWMLWWLEYHSRLMRKVKAASPMVEIREKSRSIADPVGDRACRIHAQMPKTLRREWIAHF